MVIWNHANFIVHSRSSHRALSVSFLLQSCSFVIQHCAYLNAMQNLYQTSFRLGTIRNCFQTGSNQFKPVWTSTNRSDSLLSSRTESKSFIFIPIPIPSIFINDFYKYFTFIGDSRTGHWSVIDLFVEPWPSWKCLFQCWLSESQNPVH